MPKPAYVGLETINAYVVESAADTLTSSIVGTGCDRYANRIMEIWGVLVDITPINFVADALVSQRWSLSTDPNKPGTGDVYVLDRDCIIGGVYHNNFAPLITDPTRINEGGITKQAFFEQPIEVADDELYLYLRCRNGTVVEDLRLKLYIKYKEVSKEHYLDVLETFR